MNAYELPIDGVLTELKTSKDGLGESAIKERREKYGFNELPEKKRSLILLFLRQFKDIMVYILLIALALSIAMPFVSGEELTFESFLDAIVILAILLLNAILGFVQEYKAEEAIKMLKKLSAPRCTVRRDGKVMTIPSREIVPGDILLLESGDRISAGGRILSESHLKVNESALTGESQPVEKQIDSLSGELQTAEQTNMVFMGTFVTEGSAEVVVTAIGEETKVGNIAKMVSETESPETPLQVRLKKLGKLLGIIVLSLCALVVGVGFYHGFSFIDILLIGVSLAVSAIPEGLPAVVTVCLAMGVRRMVKSNAIVRRLESIETLGSVTVICADKTGTITENHMKVVDVWMLGGTNEELLALIASSCNRAHLPDIGDPTEIGLLEYAKEKGVERLLIDDEEVPFTSEGKYMKTRHAERSFLKGAPEKILEISEERLAVSGEQMEVILQKNEEMAKKGLRVLACVVEEKGATRFVGLIGMEDPPRKGVKEAVAQARTAGIRSIMITGDHIETARAIANKVGIEGDALMGKDIDDVSKEELQQKLKKVSIFARVSPAHKLHILTALQDEGEIVAMSGDGVNDAPALKGAHVGIAMGCKGTEVAREASSIVLADDHYSTIVATVKEGRRIYDNIRKFVLFLLRSNFDEILFITTTIVLGMPLPYLPLHILWINLMTDSLPALALGVESAEPDIMKRPPRDPDEHILAGQGLSLAMAAVWGFIVSFGLYYWQLNRGVSLEQARATALTLAISFELFLVFSTRSNRPIFTTPFNPLPRGGGLRERGVGLFSNKWLLYAVSIPFALQFILILTPVRDIFHLAPFSLFEWGLVFILAASGFVVFELLKFLPRRV
jgi:P-type Ca2+ transporter type 2C